MVVRMRCSHDGCRRKYGRDRIIGTGTLLSHILIASKECLPWSIHTSDTF